MLLNVNVLIFICFNLLLIFSVDLSLAVTKREKFVGVVEVDDSLDHVVVVGGGAAGHTALETFR